MLRGAAEEAAAAAASTLLLPAASATDDARSRLLQSIYTVVGSTEGFRCGGLEGSGDPRGVCVITWSFIALGLLYALAFIGFSVTLLVLARIVVFAQTAARARARNGGFTAVRGAADNALARFNRRNPNTIYVLLIIFQVLPSILSCYFFVTRAARMNVTFGLAYTEDATNILFLILFILRFVS